MDKIYYWKTDVTELIVSLLKESPRLEGLDFLALTSEDIQPVPGTFGRFPIDEKNAVLIWGDGVEHKVSYFFRPNHQYHKSVDDAHDDLFSIDNSDSVDSANHNTFLIRDDINLKSLEIHGVRSILSTRDYKPSIPLKVNKTPGICCTGNTLHKSIDLDVIKGYPCRGHFAAGFSTFDQIKGAFEVVLKHNNVERLDVGGLNYLAPKGRVPNLNSYESKGIKEYHDLICMFLDNKASN